MNDACSCFKLCKNKNAFTVWNILTKSKPFDFFIPAILQSTFNDNAIDLMVRLAVKNALLLRTFGIAQNVVWENGYQVSSW